MSIDWEAVEARHDGAIYEEPPSTAEQAKIDAEATAAISGESFIEGESVEAREARLIAYGRNHPLVNKGCDCGEDTGFRCYPADGECSCGCHRHHVHNNCGHIVQWG